MSQKVLDAVLSLLGELTAKEIRIVKKKCGEHPKRFNRKSLKEVEWYPGIDVELRQKLIENATKAEILLVQMLSDRGIWFEFQKTFKYGLNNQYFYIVDFYMTMRNPDRGLIVEIDGEYHDDPKQMKKDSARERQLERMGNTVIRFSNKDVLETPEKVMGRIGVFHPTYKKSQPKEMLEDAPTF